MNYVFGKDSKATVYDTILALIASLNDGVWTISRYFPNVIVIFTRNNRSKKSSCLRRGPHNATYKNVLFS